MSQRTKRIKLFINIFTLVALVLLVYFSRSQIAEAFREFSSLHAWALLLIIPFQGVYYYATARQYQSFFASQNEQVRLKEMYKIGLEMNFVGSVFPSGGVSGFSYLGLRMRRYGIGVSKSTLAQLMRFALLFISFMLMMFVGMFLLALSNRTSSLIILVCSSITFLTIFGIAAVIFIISSKNRITSFMVFLPKLINKIVKPFRRHDFINIARIERVFTQLHEDYKMVGNNFATLKKSLGWAACINLAEMCAIYSVYIAFGQLINPGALIIAYAVANFAGILSVLPSGVGMYEGLMTAVLASAGIDQGLALSATVIYRVCSLGLQLSVGYYFYQRALREKSSTE